MILSGASRGLGHGAKVRGGPGTGADVVELRAPRHERLHEQQPRERVADLLERPDRHVLQRDAALAVGVQSESKARRQASIATQNPT